jgi:modification methylase
MPEPTTPSSGSVWRSGEVPVDDQLDSLYGPHTQADQTAMPPAVAAHALTRYCRRGDLVLDPDCGAGTTLIEALRSGRHAVGATADRRSWEIARANITTAKHAGAVGDGTVLAGSSRMLTGTAGAGLTGRVALVLTTIRHHRGGARRSTAAVDNLAETLSHCLPTMRPGAHVVIAARPQRAGGELVDLPGLILAAGRAVGLRPAHRRVALTAKARSATVAPDSRTRHSRCRMTPVMRVAHHDIVVFRAPDLPVAAAAPLPRDLSAVRLRFTDLAPVAA